MDAVGIDTAWDMIKSSESDDWSMSGPRNLFVGFLRGRDKFILLLVVVWIPAARDDIFGNGPFGVIPVVLGWIGDGNPTEGDG